MWSPSRMAFGWIVATLLSGCTTFNDLTPGSAAGNGDAGALPGTPTCGGATPCEAGGGCKTAEDCTSHVCLPDGTCAAPTATDGQKNGDESDVDCGGTAAPKCVLDKACGTNKDCELDACTGGKCVTPTSTDQVRNGSETDVDCGGSGVSGGGLTYQAPKCALTKGCEAGTDCLTGACSPAKKCAVPSCATAETAGITSCGVKETGDPAAVHDSCCTSLVLPTRTTRRLDKYEVTSGRFRTFLTTVGPNLRAWVKAYAAKQPTSQLATVLASFPVLEQLYPDADRAANLSLTAHMSFDIDNYDGVRGCYNDPTSFSANTYWQDDAHQTEFGLPPRSLPRTASDEKPLNCAQPILFAAFCAWDGGEMATLADYADVWPVAQPFPWGPTNLCTTGGGLGKPGDYKPCPAYNWCNGPSANGGFTCQNLALTDFDEPGIFYEFPANTDRAKDNSPLIAAPGRFPQDVTAVKSGGEGWVDLFANLGEYTGDFESFVNPDPNAAILSTFCDMSGEPVAGDTTCTRKFRPGQTGKLFSGIPQVAMVGSTWEGHQYGPGARRALPATFQYGKFGARCVRPADAY